MDGEVQFRSLGDTGFSSEHPDISNSQLNGIDRLYSANHPSLHLSPLQSFGLSLDHPPDQSTHFDILGQTLPGNTGSALEYELQVTSSLPLPPPQTPQYAQNTPLLQTNNVSLGTPSSPLRLSQVPSLFLPHAELGPGKIKCRFCARAYSSSTSVTILAKHISSAHSISTESSSKKNSKRSPSSDSSPGEAQRNFVSKYFEPVTTGSEVGKRKCVVCNVVYSQSTSSSILSRHLSKIHHIDAKPLLESTSQLTTQFSNKTEGSSEVPSEASLHKERNTTRGQYQSLVWGHFSSIETVDQFGKRGIVKKCHHCEKTYSNNTSNSGLARHLRSVHAIRLLTFVSQLPADKNSLYIESQTNQDKVFKSLETSMDLFPPDIEGIFPHINLELSPSVISNDSPDIHSQFSVADVSSHFFSGDDNLNDTGLAKSKHCRYCDQTFSPQASKRQLELHLKSFHLIKSFDFKPPSPLLNKYSFNRLEDQVIKFAPEECDYRFLLAVLSQWVLSNPEPGDLINNLYFRELVGCLDTRFQSLSLEECKLYASSLEGVRNSSAPEAESEPSSTFHYFLVRESDGNHQCIYCHFGFPRTSSAGILIRHLVQAHASHFPEGLQSPKKVPLPGSTQSSLYLLVAKFLTSDLRPVNLLNQELFLKYLILAGHSEAKLSAQSIHSAISRMYREQAPQIESLLKSSLSPVSVLVDLFKVDESRCCLVVSLSFVDQTWQPRRLVASTNWYAEGFSSLSFDGVVNTVFYSFFRCVSMQLKVVSFVINVQERFVEFKHLLETRLQNEYSSAIPVIRCLSNLVDQTLFDVISDHPVVSQIWCLASVEFDKLMNLDFYRKLLCDRDWRHLEIWFNSPAKLCNLIPRAADHISNGEWDDLSLFLTQLKPMQRTSNALYDSLHPTLSEAYVTLKGLTDQLGNVANSSQPKILNLIERLTGNPSGIHSGIHSGNPSQTLMFLATFLDPRYKHRVFGESVNYNSTLLRIKKHLTSCPTDSGLNVSSASFLHPRPTLSTVAASFFSTSTPFPEPTIPQSLEDEIELYLRLPLIEPQSNPLVWWSSHRMEFPNLHYIALEHLSVPATGHILTPSQNKLVPLYDMGIDVLPMLALWSHHRYNNVQSA